MELELAAKKTGSFEMRGSSKARKDFIKDVQRGYKFKKPMSVRQLTKKEEEQKQLSTELAIETAIGNAFPDGDPFDELYRNRRKLLPSSYSDYQFVDWLDNVVKKMTRNRRNTFYNYVADLWDDFVADTGLDDRSKNPWR